MNEEEKEVLKTCSYEENGEKKSDPKIALQNKLFTSLTICRTI